MKQKINFGIVAIILFMIFALILLIQLILKLTNHSPTDTQILYIGFGAIISYLLIMSYKLGQFVGEVRGFMAISKNSFRKISRDVECLMRASGK
ncbi:MAG: hypothetical protein NT001_07435 [Candidatus Woesearchaeota archaeon]|nr:hypothetical protein [Candidatus Woesearchaeota archaeon]